MHTAHHYRPSVCKMLMLCNPKLCLRENKLLHGSWWAAGTRLVLLWKRMGSHFWTKQWSWINTNVLRVDVWDQGEDFRKFTECSLCFCSPRETTCARRNSHTEKQMPAFGAGQRKDRGWCKAENTGDEELLSGWSSVQRFWRQVLSQVGFALAEQSEH